MTKAFSTWFLIGNFSIRHKNPGYDLRPDLRGPIDFDRASSIPIEFFRTANQCLLLEWTY